MKAARHK